MRLLSFEFATAFGRILFISAVVVLSGCATTDFGPDSNVRIASDVPDQFVVGTYTGTETTEPTPGEGCRSPLVDPRDGTRIQLVRSSSAQGDYEVPAGRYGVAGRELLRVECGTGRTVGIVRR